MLLFINTALCLKISSSQAQIDENFDNNFLKTKSNNKCLIV